MSDTYPVLSLWEPWATAIAEGLKGVETRGYRAPRSMIGRRIAIHAALRKPDVVHRLDGRPKNEWWSESFNDWRVRRIVLRIAGDTPLWRAHELGCGLIRLEVSRSL